MNLYAYCHDNPVNCVDPNGLLGERIADWWNDFSNSPDFQSLFGIPLVGGGIQAAEEAAQEIQAAEQAAEDIGWWQYYPADNPNYQTNWLTQGTSSTPPYAVGQEAQEALNLPPGNPGTAVRPVQVDPNEPIVGPQTPKPQPDWGWPNPGKGKEWYRGKQFPN